MESNQQLNDITQRFVSFLKARRLRKTPERMAILEEVTGCGSHFEVEDIYTRLDSKGYHVSRATVYSTIELLCQCGITRRLLFDMHQSYYELTGRNHIHLVCMECGRIKEVDEPEAGENLLQMRFPGFSTSYCSSIVYGVCSRCQRSARAAAKEKKKNS